MTTASRSGPCRSILNALKVGAGACILLLVVVSLVPASTVAPWRTGISHPLDHFIAYLGTAALTMLALQQSRLRPLVPVGLILLAGGLELAQNLTVTRGAHVADFMGSATGVLVGCLMGVLLRRALPRLFA